MNVICNVVQFFRPRFVHRDCRVEPGFTGFIASKQGDEVFLRHFALLNAELHDQTFLSTHAVHHDAHAVYQVVELLRHQAELFEHFGQLLNFFLRGSMAAAFRFDGVASDFVLSTQFTEFFTR